MKKRSLTSYSENKMKRIHSLSSVKNSNGSHAEKILDMIREHAQEISELFYSGDDHYITETGDLLVLCIELIMESRSDANRILDKCYRRFEEKLETPDSDKDRSLSEKQDRSSKEE
jgi:hypothetical protein